MNFKSNTHERQQADGRAHSYYKDMQPWQQLGLQSGEKGGQPEI